MKTDSTTLESIRIKWTIYGIIVAIAAQAFLLGKEYLRGETVDWMDTVPTLAAIVAVIFAVRGAVNAAAQCEREEN